MKNEADTRATPPSPAGLVVETKKFLASISNLTAREQDLCTRILTALTANGSQPDRVVDVLREAVEKIAAGRTIRFTGSEHHGKPLRDKDAQQIAKLALATLDAKDQSNG